MSKILTPRLPLFLLQKLLFFCENLLMETEVFKFSTPTKCLRNSLLPLLDFIQTVSLELEFTSQKSTMETLEQSVKFVKVSNNDVAPYSNTFSTIKSSYPEVFIGKSALKICSKFTGEHPCRSAISIKLQSNFIRITFWHGCSPIKLLRIFRAPFFKNTSGQLLLNNGFKANLGINCCWKDQTQW